MKIAFYIDVHFMLMYLILFVIILDFDECVPGSNDCDEHATCINSDGSYSCLCNEPFYTGDGYHCYGNSIFRTSGISLILKICMKNRMLQVMKCQTTQSCCWIAFPFVMFILNKSCVDYYQLEVYIQSKLSNEN